MSKRRILLIGGAGYVGTVLTSHLLKMGYKVRVFDDFVYENQFAVHSYLGDPDFEIQKGDLADEEDLSIAIQNVSSVVILGGLVGDPITKRYPDVSNEINTKGVQSCIHFLNEKGLDKVIFISTCSNYGLIKENEIADEEFELNPLSLYATAKVEAEKLLLSYKEEADYTGVVLRFATAFGLSPRMRFDLTVNQFTRDLYFGKELVVFDEHTWRPYCHVRDFSRLVDIVLNADKNDVNFEVFNAGTEKNNFTKKMIIDEILKHDPSGTVKYTGKGDDPRNYRVSFEKVKTTLNFEPDYTVENGIKELIEAFEIGVYSDAFKNSNKYGNFEINYQIEQ